MSSRSSSVRFVFACSLACALVACGEKGSGGGDGDGDAETDGADSDGESGPGGSDGGATGTQGGTDGGETGDSDGSDPDEELKEIHADGFTVTQVSANQGVAVPIYENGAWVGANRVAELPQRRESLIQILWDVAPDWEPREIVGQLTILPPEGGAPLVARKTLMVEAESYAGSFDRSFWWALPAELTVTGTKFQAEFFEAQKVPESTPEPDNPPIAPAQPELVGFEDSYQVLRAVLVPIKHELEGQTCPDAPTITEEDAAVFREFLHLQNPVELTEVRVREPFVYTGAMTSFNGLLSAVADLHGSDPDADVSEYYYGLVIPCDGGPDGVGGQAISIPNAPLRSNAYTRTSVGRWYSSALRSADTFVHEVGHTQGRRHVECSGGEGGPDPRYPHDGGAIGVWGFGIPQPDPATALAFSIHSPTSAKDYMTYCGQPWVSDWGWRQVYPFIQEISSWDMSDGAEPEGTLLFGNIEADGTEHWITVPGALDAVTRGQFIEFEIDGRTVTAPAYVEDRPAGCGPNVADRSDSINVLAEVPDGVQRATAITRIDGGVASPVDVGGVSFNARTLRAP